MLSGRNRYVWKTAHCTQINVFFYICAIKYKNTKCKQPNPTGGDDLGSLFASAEEFSTLLEETATNKKQGSSQAVANTDNASTKQLAWEDNRAQWIKGYNRKILGNKSNNKKFKNKKGNFNKSDNKSKPNKKGFNKMADKGGKRKGAKVNGPGGKKKKMKWLICLWNKLLLLFFRFIF